MCMVVAVPTSVFPTSVSVTVLIHFQCQWDWVTSTGDHEKALSILTKALAKGKAQPKELIIRAIKSAEAGQCKLLSDQERKLQGNES